MDSDDCLYRGAQPRARRLSKVRANRRQVVILRQSSNFGGATFPRIYSNRDCPVHFHTAVAAHAGSAQLEWRLLKQAIEAISGRVQQSCAPGAGAKCHGAPAVPDRLEQEWCSLASGSF